MGLSALKAPSMVWLIRKIGTGGTVGLSPINVGSLSVPESYGGNMVTSQVFRHWPLSQRSWLSIPMNQSGDGASILIRDTLEKLEVTLTWILVSSSTAPSPDPGRMSCKAFPPEIWDSISPLRVPVWPMKNVTIFQIFFDHHRISSSFTLWCCEAPKYWTSQQALIPRVFFFS